MYKARNNALTVLLAVALAGLTTFIFFPGLMSFDSIYLYRQAIGELPVVNYHPPIMVYAWRLGNFVAGPGGMLIIHQAMYWIALAVIAICVSRKLWIRVLLILSIGLLPPLWINSATLWNDIGVMSAFLLATAGILVLQKTGSRRVFAITLVALFYGIAAKRTALLAAIPLFYLLVDAYFSVPTNRMVKQAVRWPKTAAVAAAWFAAVVLAAHLVNTIGVEKWTKWPTVAVWDLAAVSLEENQLLIPKAVVNRKDESEAETLERLKVAFKPEVNGPLVNVANFFPAPEHRDELFYAWLDLPTQYPASYFGHRTRVMARLLGLGPDRIHMAFEHRIIPNEQGLRLLNKDRPPLVGAVRWVSRTTDTVVYQPWFYLVLLLAISVMAALRLRRANTFDRRFLLALGISGLAYVAPLFFIAPAADFRYNLWMVACSAVMAGFAICRR